MIVTPAENAAGARRLVNNSKEIKTMINPDQTYDYPAVFSHAYARAKQRYGLDLTWGDLYEIAGSVEDQQGVYLYSGSNLRGRTFTYAVEQKGVLLLVVLGRDADGFKVITALPPEAFYNVEVGAAGRQAVRSRFCGDLLDTLMSRIGNPNVSVPLSSVPASSQLKQQNKGNRPLLKLKKPANASEFNSAA